MIYLLSYYYLIHDIAKATLDHPERGLMKKQRAVGEGKSYPKRTIQLQQSNKAVI